MPPAGNPKRSKIVRFAYLAAGFLALAIGIVGVVVPLLPTTPFLLLAAWCFARSSERFLAWLLGHPRLGPPIRDWRDHGVIRPGAKLLATAMIVPGTVIVLTKQNIPVGGKGAFALFMGLLLTFLWTRRSR